MLGPKPACQLRLPQSLDSSLPCFKFEWIKLFFPSSVPPVAWYQCSLILSITSLAGSWQGY